MLSNSKTNQMSQIRNDNKFLSIPIVIFPPWDLTFKQSRYWKLLQNFQNSEFHELLKH